MILGMSTHTFTQVHVLISLISMGTGFIVLLGMLGGRILRYWNGTFLVATIATSMTGFLFPITKVTPGIILGIISLLVLTMAVVALKRGSLRAYVIGAAIALYLNFFVLVVQLFEHVPSLHALAPTGSEPPFAITQAVVVAIFMVLTVRAAKKFGHAGAAI
jgi:hypothetical protein